MSGAVVGWCRAVGRSCTVALPPEMEVSAPAVQYWGHSAESNAPYLLQKKNHNTGLCSL